MSRKSNKSYIKSTIGVLKETAIPVTPQISAISNTVTLTSPVPSPKVESVASIQFTDHITSSPTPLTFNKVSVLPKDLTSEDIGSLWLCDEDRILWIWTTEGWARYDGGNKGGGSAENVVLYIEQDLSDEEATQARRNIKSPVDPGMKEGDAIIRGSLSVGGVGDVKDVLNGQDVRIKDNYDGLLELKSRVDVIDDELHPWTLSSFTVSPGSLFEKYTSHALTFNWKTNITGSTEVTLPDETYWNGIAMINSPQSTMLAINDGSGTYTYALRVVRGAKDISKSLQVRFVMRSYWGIVPADTTTLTESSVKALSKNSLRTSRGGTYDGVNLNNEKVAWCYPAEFGKLTKILDGNNFDLIDSFTQSEVTFSTGDKYYIYILNKPVTNTGLKFIFS